MEVYVVQKYRPADDPWYGDYAYFGAYRKMLDIPNEVWDSHEYMVIRVNIDTQEAEVWSVEAEDWSPYMRVDWE